MKQLYLIIVCSLLVYSCTDNLSKESKNLQNEGTLTELDYRISEDRAIDIFNEYINDLPNTKSSASTVSVVGCAGKYSSEYNKSATLTRSSSEGDDVLIYELITEDEEGEIGFALVVGDERFSEVIAYSPQGALADTVFNEGLAGYMQMIGGVGIPVTTPPGGWQLVEAEYWQREGAGSYVIDWDSEEFVKIVSEEEADAWPDYSPWETPEKITRFIPVRWDQEDPYNKNAPYCHTKKARIGCGPVALGQLMAYHRKPASFNWDLLTENKKITSSSPYETIVEVNRLMSYLAQKDMLNVDYRCNPEGGGVGGIYPDDPFRALPKMGYSCKYGLFDSEQVNYSIVREELVNDRPMLIIAKKSIHNGVSTFVGHIWVIDGCYKKSRWAYRQWYGHLEENRREITQVRQYLHQLHFNWGWGGRSDGWYHIPRPHDYNNAYKFQQFDLITNIQ